MLIETRRLGSDAPHAGLPHAVRTILVGETLGRYAIALLQGVLIVAGTVLLFRVDWGDPAHHGDGRGAVRPGGHRRGDGDGLGPEERRAGRQRWVCSWAGAGARSAAAWFRSRSFLRRCYRIAHLTPHAWAIEALNGLDRDRTPAPPRWPRTSQCLPPTRWRCWRSPPSCSGGRSPAARCEGGGRAGHVRASSSPRVTPAVVMTWRSVLPNQSDHAQAQTLSHPSRECWHGGDRSPRSSVLCRLDV